MNGPSTGFLITIAGTASVAFAILGCNDSTNATTGPCGAPATRIHEIQGAGRSSPLLGSDQGGEEVVVEAIVVGLFPDLPEGLGGFFLQEEDEDTDDDPRTSEGLFVFDVDVDGDGDGDDGDPSRIAIGDRLRVRGRVTEFFGMTEMTRVSERIRCPRGGRASATKIRLPVDDESDWERWEGMRVEFDQALVVTDHRNIGRFGEVDLAAGTRLEQPTQRREPGLDALAFSAQNARRRILIDDGSRAVRPEPIPYLDRDDGGTLRLGDALDHLEGVLSFGFGRFRVHPTRPVHFVPGTPRPAEPPEVGGTLRIVSWNVENHMNGDGRGGGFPTRGPRSPIEYERQRTKLVETLLRLDPDIASLVEIENDGTGPESAVGELVRELNRQSSGDPFSVIHPDMPRLGSHPIAVGILYREDRVAPIGPAAILDARANAEFDDRRNRPSLAQAFRSLATGESLTIVVNHFKSKGSDCDSSDDPDANDGQGECNGTRTRAARALIAWLAAGRGAPLDTPVLLTGDLNAYPLEDPVRATESAGYVDLLAEFAEPGEYTFVFDGQAGRLDHALADAALLPFVAGAGVWHINSDEPRIFDYRLDHPPGRYEPSAFRASDHDPVLIGLFPDADADGFVDLRDPCPLSHRSLATSLDACVSDVPDRVDGVGCTLSDELLEILDSGLGEDTKTSAVQGLLEARLGTGRASPREAEATLACAMRVIEAD